MHNSLDSLVLTNFIVGIGSGLVVARADDTILVQHDVHRIFSRHCYRRIRWRLVLLLEVYAVHYEVVCGAHLWRLFAHASLQNGLSLLRVVNERFVRCRLAAVNMESAPATREAVRDRSA